MLRLKGISQGHHFSPMQMNCIVIIPVLLFKTLVSLFLNNLYNLMHFIPTFQYLQHSEVSRNIQSEYFFLFQNKYTQTISLISFRPYFPQLFFSSLSTC